MGEGSKIEWTHHTFNPWWGCEKISPACKHCYAAAFSKRTGHQVWGSQAPRRFFGDKHWNEPRRWNARAEKDGERRRVFCASMADVFEDRRDLDEHRARLWDLIGETPWLDWLLLTKRPQNARRLAPDDVLRRCWLGTTAEDQAHANTRIPELLACPAAVYFISYEPALGALRFNGIPANLPPLHGCDGAWDWFDALSGIGKAPNPEHSDGQVFPKLDWIIVGAESGPGARPFDVDWARSVIAQCREAGVPCFIKQLGARPLGVRDDARRLRKGESVFHDRKGGDPEEWPADLRVRQFPEVTP